MKSNNRYISLILSFILLFAASVAKGGERPFASLLTCSPGDEVYAYFGHTALRICNPSKKQDIVFSYGVFDFSEPGFVAKFISGETDYMLGVIDYPYFIQEYAMRGSEVTEQVLALDSAQTAQLITLLRENLRPANSTYRYNYFYNNCTTKARDIIEAAVAGSGKIRYNPNDVQETFRDIVHRFTSVSPWYSFGIDLLLGSEADLPQDARTQQFIPSTLMKDFSTATIVTGDSIRPLVASESKIIEKIDDEENGSSFFTPTVAFTLLLAMVALTICIERKRKRIYWGIDLLLLALQGIAGVQITYMLFFSIHPTVDSNQLALLLNPLPLVILPIYLYTLLKHRNTRIMWVETAIAALFLSATPLLTQYFPTPVYIFAATLLVRSISTATYKQE